MRSHLLVVGLGNWYRFQEKKKKKSFEKRYQAKNYVLNLSGKFEEMHIGCFGTLLSVIRLRDDDKEAIKFGQDKKERCN